MTMSSVVRDVANAQSWLRPSYIITSQQDPLEPAAKLQRRERRSDDVVKDFRRIIFAQAEDGSLEQRVASRVTELRRLVEEMNPRPNNDVLDSAFRLVVSEFYARRQSAKSPLSSPKADLLLALSWSLPQSGLGNYLLPAHCLQDVIEQVTY